MSIKEILNKHGKHKEQLLSILHEIQENDPGNHISEEAMHMVANWLHLPLSSVYGVLKYYSMYSTTPRGKHLIRVCSSVVCKMQGSDGLSERINEVISELNLQSPVDQMFSVETTECLGFCEGAPAIMVDDATIGPVNEAEVKDLIVVLKNKS